MDPTALTQQDRLTKLRHAAQSRRIEEAGHASIDEQVSDVLVRAAVKAAERRFTGVPPTGFGSLK